MSCFKFLKRRLPDSTIKSLNGLLNLKCKIVSSKCQLEFLSMCIRNNSYARPFSKTLRQNRLRTSTSNLKRLTKSHMEETKTKLNQLNETYSKVVAVLDDLSIVCWVKFKKFCKGILDRTRKSTMQQHLFTMMTR